MIPYAKLEFCTTIQKSTDLPVERKEAKDAVAKDGDKVILDAQNESDEPHVNLSFPVLP